MLFIAIIQYNKVLHLATKIRSIQNVLFIMAWLFKERFWKESLENPKDSEQDPHGLASFSTATTGENLAPRGSMSLFFSFSSAICHEGC